MIVKQCHANMWQSKILINNNLTEFGLVNFGELFDLPNLPKFFPTLHYALQCTVQCGYPGTKLNELLLEYSDL